MITTIVFDMNGVITDDEDIHELATQEIFSKIGITIDSEIYRNYCLGRTDVDAFKDLFKKYRIQDQDINNFIAAKSIRYQQLIHKNLKVYPHVIQLIKELNQRYTLALTSSSTYDEVNAVVKLLDIEKLFKVIITSRDVTNGKPDPEPYILTAKRLNVNIEDCLVIEDSGNGIQSAKSAGMKCVAISNTEDPMNLSRADRIIDNCRLITDNFIQNV